MSKPRKPGNEKLRDTLVAILASTTFVQGDKQRFLVDFNSETSRWEIPFNDLSAEEFTGVIEAARASVSSDAKFNFGERAIRVANLKDHEAEGFARAVAREFQAKIVK
jgi:hypothetical protein